MAVVLEEPAQTLVTNDFAVLIASGLDQFVAQSLVIALGMLVCNVLFERATQVALA